jgi:hypothetical protein
MAGNSDNKFSDDQREEIKNVAREEMLNQGIPVNGDHTREENIKRFQWIDRMRKWHDSAATWIGRAIIWGLMLVFVGWMGSKIQ